MLNKKNVFVLAVGAALVGLLGIAAANEDQQQYKLAGGFIGNNGAGNIWNALQIRLDPARRTAALRVNLTTYNAEFAGLLTAFGADAVSDWVGEVTMISRDTAKYRSVAYATFGDPTQLCAILVMNGTVQFTGPDNITVNYTVDVYPADVHL